MPTTSPSCVATAVTVAASDCIRLGVISGDGLGQPEVQNLHQSRRGHLDVGGLQIAMDDPALVRGVERIGDLPGHRQRLGNRQRPSRQSIRDRLPLDQLHHQRLDAVGVFDAVNGGDVRMIERRQDARFALEARPSIGIGGEGVRQDLHGHVALQPRVACAIDLAHATCTDALVQLVDAKTAAGQLSIHGVCRGIYVLNMPACYDAVVFEAFEGMTMPRSLALLAIVWCLAAAQLGGQGEAIQRAPKPAGVAARRRAPPTAKWISQASGAPTGTSSTTSTTR